MGKKTSIQRRNDIRADVETTSELTSERRCKNVENANRSDVDCKTLVQCHETTLCQRQNTTSI